MWAACYMAVFAFSCSSEFTVPPSITTTLKYICHSQISHWIEGASPLWCVYILSRPKLTLPAGCSNLLGQNLPADLPVKAIVFYLAVHTLQCVPCSAVKQARACIHPLQWQDAYHGHNWNISTKICVALGLVLQHLQNRLVYQMCTSRL